MSHFLKSGSSWRVASEEAIDLHKQLPPGNYTPQQDAYDNFYLEHIESFDLPSKLYGETIRHTERIINTFFDRPMSTGVMLNGEKGSGKTLLAKSIASSLAQRDVPTIVINKEWTGDAFFKFLQDITQPCIVLFDEFEKVYDKDGQESILTLLDGVFGSKKLYIITCNDKWRVDTNMRNRPGRIYYMLDFKGLASEFIEEYCNDNLIDKHHIPNLVSIASLFGEFNFDMLKAVVEEMNRYHESPSEVLTMLNAKPEFDEGTTYNVKMIYNNKILDTDDTVCPRIYKGNPMRATGVHMEYDPDPGNDDSDWKNIHFQPDSLINVNVLQGEFTFESQGSKLILTRIRSATNVFDYSSLIY